AIGLFYHRDSKKTYRVINVRMPDYQNYNVELAVRKIRGYLSLSGSDYNILMGNVNIQPFEKDFAVFEEGEVLNAWDVSAQRCREQYSTFAEMDPASKVHEILDYIFTDHPDIFWVCVDERIANGFFLSSHHPVFMIIRQ
ncbi:MAG: hypothetical protein AAF193_03885, partial [Bacteroidota bacterium]